MTELYNTTWMDNATNPAEIIVGLGTSMGNPYLIGNLLLLGFFLVFLLLSFKFDFIEVLAIDSFVTTIIAMLLAFAGIVAFPTIIFPAVIFFISLIFLLINR